MNAQVTDLKPKPKAAPAEAPQPTGLALLRAPFPPHQISKLPKESKNQREERDKDKSKMVWKCPECGGAHHIKAVHLDYVGHAALTDRLLDVDPNWSWEPAGLTANGLPAFDNVGGLWIKLTVCGLTRLGYGCADGKSGGDAVKEIIGDALRNAAMRFGAALDLWHKGDLHAEEVETPQAPAPSAEDRAIAHLRANAVDRGLFKDAWEANKDGWRGLMDEAAYRRVVSVMKQIAAGFAQAEPAPAPPPKAESKPEPSAAIAAISDDEIPF